MRVNWNTEALCTCCGKIKIEDFFIKEGRVLCPICHNLLRRNPRQKYERRRVLNGRQCPSCYLSRNIIALNEQRFKCLNCGTTW